ncbi:hypothetical protein F5Y15DRAFT_425252 [Xylariaceae sp. FL0016]|nr:hypothetical protein F5Y15DRAFT_425252 [Xylariaceae sp. FL0016]
MPWKIRQRPDASLLTAACGNLSVRRIGIGTLSLNASDAVPRAANRRSLVGLQELRAKLERIASDANAESRFSRLETEVSYVKEAFEQSFTDTNNPQYIYDSCQEWYATKHAFLVAILGALAQELARGDHVKSLEDLWTNAVLLLDLSEKHVTNITTGFLLEDGLGLFTQTVAQDVRTLATAPWASFHPEILKYCSKMLDLVLPDAEEPLSLLWEDGDLQGNVKFDEIYSQFLKLSSRYTDDDNDRRMLIYTSIHLMERAFEELNLPVRIARGLTDGLFDPHRPTYVEHPCYSHSFIYGLPGREGAVELKQRLGYIMKADEAAEIAQIPEITEKRWETEIERGKEKMISKLEDIENARKKAPPKTNTSKNIPKNPHKKKTGRKKALEKRNRTTGAGFVSVHRSRAPYRMTLKNVYADLLDLKSAKEVTKAEKQNRPEGSKLLHRTATNRREILRAWKGNLSEIYNKALGEYPSIGEQRPSRGVVRDGLRKLNTHITDLRSQVELGIRTKYQSATKQKELRLQIYELRLLRTFQLRYLLWLRDGTSATIMRALKDRLEELIWHEKAWNQADSIQKRDRHILEWESILGEFGDIPDELPSSDGDRHERLGENGDAVLDGEVMNTNGVEDDNVVGGDAEDYIEEEIITTADDNTEQEDEDVEMADANSGDEPQADEWQNSSAGLGLQSDYDSQISSENARAYEGRLHKVLNFKKAGRVIALDRLHENNRLQYFLDVVTAQANNKAPEDVPYDSGSVEFENPLRADDTPEGLEYLPRDKVIDRLVYMIVLTLWRCLMVMTIPDG